MHRRRRVITSVLSGAAGVGVMSASMGRDLVPPSPWVEALDRLRASGSVSPLLFDQTGSMFASRSWDPARIDPCELRPLARLTPLTVNADPRVETDPGTGPGFAGLPAAMGSLLSGARESGGVWTVVTPKAGPYSLSRASAFTSAAAPEPWGKLLADEDRASEAFRQLLVVSTVYLTPIVVFSSGLLVRMWRDRRQMERFGKTR